MARKKKDDAPEPVEAEATEHVNVKDQPIEQEMKTSYLDYSMSVIVGRALPDIRDGLKPVHRRILYAMNDMGLVHNRPFKKSARVVGEVLGKYHPHGDTAVYDSMVRMAQNFSLRYMLVDGQGNFGSVDGDSAAAMRYTEARMTRIAEEMLADIDKETVDFVDNFDGSLKEPTVLPSKFPNLLVNGSSGIAVGMATNIPPHNLGEVVDGLVTLIDNPETELIDLMEIVKAPDFPTGGIIYGINGIAEAYHTGRGIMKIRARAHVEDMGGERSRIVVTEIPYQVNKARLLESIADLVKNKHIDGITDLRDESDRKGLRIVIELRRGVSDEVILNQLFKHTQMQSTFGIINLALVNGKPKILTLKQMLQHYIDYRKEVVTRRTRHELEKAKARAHILEGLLIALDNIDEIIKIIRKSKNADEAREQLMIKFILSELQAKAILDMRLQKLTNMERQGIKDEAEQLAKAITHLTSVLEDEKLVYGIIKDEFKELKSRYGDERRTEIVTYAEDLDIEDLIPEEDVIITKTSTGYIKRLDVDTYRQQRRGGVGLIGMETKEEDYVVDMFLTSTHDYIMFFTNLGRVYWLKAWQIPIGGRHAKGKPIVNLLPRLEKNETVQTMMHIKEFKEGMNLVFATKRGMIKKTALKAYSRPRVTGIIALKLKKGDELVETMITDGEAEIILATKKGLAARFNEKDVRSIGRPGMGVRGIRLNPGDEVVGMEVVHKDSDLITITENGYGKITPVHEYRKIHRGGKGVITIKCSQRNGDVVSIVKATTHDQLIVTSKNGMVIRIPVFGISILHRSTQGVRIMKMKKGDRIMAIAKMVKEKEVEREVEEETTIHKDASQLEE